MSSSGSGAETIAKATAATLPRLLIRMTLSAKLKHFRSSRSKGRNWRKAVMKARSIFSHSDRGYRPCERDLSSNSQRQRLLSKYRDQDGAHDSRFRPPEGRWTSRNRASHSTTSSSSHMKKAIHTSSLRCLFSCSAIMPLFPLLSAILDTFTLLLFHPLLQAIRLHLRNLRPGRNTDRDLKVPIIRLIIRHDERRTTPRLIPIHDSPGF